MPARPPLFVLRPIFVGWIVLLVQLPIQLFLTFWAGGFFGGLLMSAFHAGGSRAYAMSGQSWTPFIVCGAIAFVAVPLVAYVGKKFNYQRTEYKVFDDRLEFEEGFFTINKKVIKFRDVKEVTLRRGVLQRTQNLGTVYLATLATGSSGASSPFRALGFGNVSASGVNVRDVADPETVYTRIRQIIDASNDSHRL